MEKRRLGNSDLEISRIGIGSYALGGSRWKFAWGPQDDNDSIAAIRHALDSGVNWIDTAPAYGLGHAEGVVKQALEGRATKPYIFTKCGLAWDDTRQLTPNLTRDSVRKEAEASLERLGVDTIDLYQVHWPRDEAHLEEGWEAMARLKEEGKVRYIGVSNFSVEQMQRVATVAPITSLQPPYSAVCRDIEEAILPHAKANGIGVIAYAPLQNGLLSGKMTRERIAALPEDDWRRDAEQFKDPALSRNLAVAEEMQKLAQELGCGVPDVAVAWVLKHPAVTGAIVGARRAEQVDGFVRGTDIQLDAAAVARINSAYQGG